MRKNMLSGHLDMKIPTLSRILHDAPWNRPVWLKKEPFQINIMSTARSFNDYVNISLTLVRGPSQFFFRLSSKSSFDHSLWLKHCGIGNSIWIGALCFLLTSSLQFAAGFSQSTLYDLAIMMVHAKTCWSFFCWGVSNVLSVCVADYIVIADRQHRPQHNQDRTSAHPSIQNRFTR